MLQKKDLETVLNINGVTASSPDEEIRSVLLSARYNNEEVDAALMILRQDSVTHEARVDALHKIFRTNDGLNPADISALLGVDVNLQNAPDHRKRGQKETSWLQTIITTIVAAIIALAGVILAMYVYQVGIFHPSASSLGAF